MMYPGTEERVEVWGCKGGVGVGQGVWGVRWEEGGGRGGSEDFI